MGLIYDLANPEELVGFVRGVEQELATNRLILNQFLPNKPLKGITWTAMIDSLEDEDSAELRAWDAESPIGGRQGIRRIAGTVVPSSKKYRLGEEETLRLEELTSGDSDPVIDAIFNDARKGARAVSMRFERLRAEALWRGSLNINENGVVQTIPFGRSGSHTDVLPSTVWSNHASATPLTDEIGFLTTYKASNNDLEPAVALASDTIINHLLLNAQYRDFAAIGGNTPAFLNLGQLNTIRAAYNLPPIVAYNVKARVKGVQTRLIPEDRFIYLPPSGEGLGVTFTGTTAEAIKLAAAKQIQQDQMPGMVAVVNETDDPVATWTKTVAIGFPVLMNPDLTFVADVL